MEKLNYKRLESLDVLRGFDLFCLVGLESVMHAVGRCDGCGVKRERLTPSFTSGVSLSHCI